MPQTQPFPRRALGLLAVLAFLAVLSTLVWLGPTVAAWVNTGRWISLPFWTAQGAAIHVAVSSGPSRYPAALRAARPAPLEFWTIQALLVITVLATAGALIRELDVRASRPAADRRWWQLRGVRPRAFARPRTVSELLCERPHPDRVVIGYYGCPARLLPIEPNVQTLVVAAPRSGKTSGTVIPALLEHQGAAVNTTVRSDVLRATEARRRGCGRVWVWNPFGEHTDSWDPLAGCQDWKHALLVARWLSQAVRLGTGQTQEYFDQEAQGLTAPLVHAAAIAHEYTIVDVYRWILRREREIPERLLKEAHAEDALERLKNVYSYTERQRDGIIGTAGVQLQAYGNPAAARTADRGRGGVKESVSSIAPGLREAPDLPAMRNRASRSQSHLLSPWPSPTTGPTTQDAVDGVGAGRSLGQDGGDRPGSAARTIAVRAMQPRRPARRSVCSRRKPPTRSRLEERFFASGSLRADRSGDPDARNSSTSRLGCQPRVSTRRRSLSRGRTGYFSRLRAADV